METKWLNREWYPFTSRHFNIDGHHMHYIDEGAGETILFVHGTPSWSFDFRNVILALRQSFRCVAVDHIGFGLSDKPADYDYSTQNHSRTLERFIMELGLRDITLVVHDFGGPIGLSMAMRHPELIRRVVVLNSWLWSSDNDPAFRKMKTILKSPLLPFLYRFLNFSPKVLLPASFGQKKLTRGERVHYTKPFAKISERKGTLAFARSLLNDQAWFQELWEQRNGLADKPFLFIWGLQDKFVSERFLLQFAGGFPLAKVKTLPCSGHFPQEEEPAAVARFINEFFPAPAINV